MTQPLRRLISHSTAITAAASISNRSLVTPAAGKESEIWFRSMRGTVRANVALTLTIEQAHDAAYTTPLSTVQTSTAGVTDTITIKLFGPFVRISVAPAAGDSTSTELHIYGDYLDD